MEFFFSENIDKNFIILESMEFRHCIKVMRNSIGDSINIVDGKGTLFEGEIISINRGNCQVEIKNVIKNYSKRKYYTHIAISPIKNHDRLEWFVEKAVEIGVEEISFIYCSRTLRKKIKLERLYKRAIAAIKQTLKAKTPIINAPIDIKGFIEKLNSKNNFICHLENDKRKTLFSFKNHILKYAETCILIGPEGDFTLDEIALCENRGFHSVTLGDSRLRTETAGIVGCNIINMIHNDSN